MELDFDLQRELFKHALDALAGWSPEFQGEAPTRTIEFEDGAGKLERLAWRPKKASGRTLEWRHANSEAPGAGSRLRCDISGAWDRRLGVPLLAPDTKDNKIKALSLYPDCVRRSAISIIDYMSTRVSGNVQMLVEKIDSTLPEIDHICGLLQHVPIAGVFTVFNFLPESAQRYKGCVRTSARAIGSALADE